MPLSPEAAASTTHMPSGGYSAVQGGRGDSSASLFELPVSPGAKRLRIALIAFFNLLLLGGAAALVLGYFDKRDKAGAAPATSDESTASSAAGPVAADAAPAAAIGEGPRDAGVATTPRVDPRTPSTPGLADAAPRAIPVDRRRDAGTGATNTQPTGRAPDAGPPVIRQDNRKPGRTGPDAGTRASSGGRRGPDASVGAAPIDNEPVDVNVLANRIGLVVQRSQSKLNRCYERAAKTGTPSEPLKGRIDIRFTLQPSGKAKAPTVVSNTSGSEVLAQCLVGLVRRLDLPSSGNQELEFVWPFEFQAP